jgi:hypothetical protein
MSQERSKGRGGGGWIRISYESNGKWNNFELLCRDCLARLVEYDRGLCCGNHLSTV